MAGTGPGSALGRAVAVINPLLDLLAEADTIGLRVSSAQMTTEMRTAMSRLLRHCTTMPVFALAVTSVSLIGLASPAISRAVPADGCGYGMYFNTDTNQCEPGGVDPHPIIGPVGPVGVGVGGPAGPGGVVGPVGVGPVGPGPVGPGPVGPGRR